MVSPTEVKLLTLLNVTATKRPKDQDVPGGHRGPLAAGALTRRNLVSTALQNGIASAGESVPSPRKGKAASRNGTASPGFSPGTAKHSTAANGTEGGAGVKRKKSVVFGGEVGPSGSSYGAKRQKVKVGEKVVNGDAAPGESAVAAGSVAGPSKWLGEQSREGEEEEESEDEAMTQSASQDLFNAHFGVSPPQLTAANIAKADEGAWSSSQINVQGYGRAVLSRLEGSESGSERDTRITPSLAPAISESTDPLLPVAMEQVGSYRDLYLHSMDRESDGSEKKLYGPHREAMRKAVVIHALNHVLKTRRKIVRNNEKLAHAAAQDTASSAAPPDPPRDQSFTRPKILLLLPLRSLVLHYLTAHLFPLAPAGTQIENQRPFISSFSVPADATDPLAQPSATSQYPIDHLVNFRGNSDDNFRIGIKITRKAWRIVMMPANEAKMMDCDILIASPLGIKMMSEKERSTDLLASIEVAVVDGVDTMMMQNWDHVQFIFQNLNKIPESPHGCDFSRVKPWYLESQAKYLRQTILLSRYDTPEARALLSQHCFNVAGRIRLDKAEHKGVMSRVRPGVKQVFERVDMGLKSGEGSVEEVEKRFDFFINKTIPALLKSAVSRQNTLIIIPSYFDFVRVTHYLRKSALLGFSAISEYSSNSEISRARTLFFKAKKPFLIMTERFHFYRRYRIRGAKTIVWYQAPEHAQFYSELLETPFLPPQGKDGAEPAEGAEVEVDEGEISSRVLWSRYDKLRLERVVGTENWRRMLASEDGRSTFI